MSGSPVVEISGLSFSYDGAPVLAGVDLLVEERDFVSLIGPNGGGKTTLLKLMLGLLQPTSGTLRVFGRPPAEARTHIGYVPQQVSLDPKFPVSVMDVVLMGRLAKGRILGRYTRADRKTAEFLLDTVGLSGQIHSPFSSLSGGQQQRALIARALACEPDLFLLDEPTANLDLRVESELHGLLKELNNKMTIVLVSHDLGFVTDLVKKVVCVNRTVAVHPTSELTGDSILEIYGGDVRLVRHDHKCSPAEFHV